MRVLGSSGIKRSFNSGVHPGGTLGDSSGVALIITVFLIAFITILVMGTLESVRYYQRASRAYSEEVQARFVLQSGLNLAKVLLEIPKQEGISEDWLGDPWNLIGAFPALLITDFAGTPQLMIVDEDGKLDINAIDGSRSSYLGTIVPPDRNPAASGSDTSSLIWKNVLRELFLLRGFQPETYEDGLFRTLGGVSFGPSDQVAVIADWIDSDSTADTSAVFDGEGIESSGNEMWFYNRPLRSLSELALVPGMTLSRLNRIAPFVKASQNLSISNTKVNVNTAPYEVLLALGFPESVATEMIQERMNLPIDTKILGTLVQGDPQLQRITKVNSGEFGVYCRVTMPNSTRWLKALLTVQGRGAGRKAAVRTVEFY